MLREDMAFNQSFAAAMSNEGILPASWMYNPRDSAFSSSVLESSSSSPSDFQFLKFGLRDEFYHRILLGIKYFYPLDVIPYDKISAATELGAAIDWRSHGQKHSESIYTRFCQSIYQPTRHGFEYRRAHLSADICKGRIDRERAIDCLRLLLFQNFKNHRIFVLSLPSLDIQSLN